MLNWKLNTQLLPLELRLKFSSIPRNNQSVYTVLREFALRSLNLLYQDLLREFDPDGRAAPEGALVDVELGRVVRDGLLRPVHHLLRLYRHRRVHRTGTSGRSINMSGVMMLFN